ncbi:phosphatase PAP2 family protein [Natrarchaeobius halalkaliphilus]|uniref:Phosphatase PAP2 family protein n=1 Tax=Natrarchaeobius halalkaliphilus TaxID=1679091 RepID=A0A3N6M5J8_9EURY|nr:phosphatase PAP2 family protein [Natrarchaeobius halalkaliphilus]RQG91300.1 phosphatase PAP2 family protein [Natrarchaeobius halalkaliphilus]
MRLEAESATVREWVSAEYADIVLAVIFWLAGSNRRQSALVISYALGGMAFLLTVKTVLAVPRPPESALLVPLEVSGYGFPSGHAFAAVVVYGGLCTAFDRVRHPPSLVAVAAIVALVSLSRVILGVHYLGDVIAGALLGVVVLFAMDRLTAGDPRTGFVIATVLAVPAAFVTGGSESALIGLGSSLGGLVAVRWLSALPALRSALEGVVLVAVGLCGLFVIRTVAAAAPTDSLFVVMYALLVCWVVLVPAGVGRLPIAALETSSPAS